MHGPNNEIDIKAQKFAKLHMLIYWKRSTREWHSLCVRLSYAYILHGVQCREQHGVNTHSQKPINKRRFDANKWNKWNEKGQAL